MKETMQCCWRELAGEKSVLAFSAANEDLVYPETIKKSLEKFSELKFRSDMRSRFLTLPAWKGNESKEHIQNYWWSRSILVCAIQDALDRGLDPEKTYFSLSHTRDACVVVGAEVFSGGVGVDLELAKRPVNTQLASRVSDSHEEISSLSPLEVWVIKEACFKANPNNAGTVLTHYRIAETKNQRGVVKFHTGSVEFNFRVHTDDVFTVAFAKTI